jgi:hypothetical protein
MNTQNLDEILGRAIRDKDYRQQLISNPEETLRESGISADDRKMLLDGLREKEASSFFESLDFQGTRMAWSSEKGSYQSG